MDIRLEPTYTAEEIAQVLLESEGRSTEWDPPSGKFKGHAEGKHALLPAGPGHTGNTIRNASSMALGQHPNYKKAGIISFFHSRQPDAIAFALNRNSGQAALRFLHDISECYAVFAELDIWAGGSNMKCFYPKGLPDNLPAEVTIPNRDRLEAVNENWKTLLVPVVGVAGGLCIKLMKTGGRGLHIRTAFPTFETPAPSTAELCRSGAPAQIVQLPI
jgi:hypothetical protein